MTSVRSLSLFFRFRFFVHVLPSSRFPKALRGQAGRGSQRHENRECCIGDCQLSVASCPLSGSRTAMAHSGARVLSQA